MALTERVKNNFNLSRGFISDASAVNFPEDATTDELNFSIEKDGSRRKRYGVDITYTGTPSLTAISNPDGLTTSSYVWYNPSNLDKKFLVIQTNQYLDVYNITNSPEDYTTERLLNYDLLRQRDRSEARNSWTIGDYSRLQYTAGSGFLFITASGLYPITLTYSDDTGEVTVDRLNLKIRDFEGVPEQNANEVYSISPESYYNLLNAGYPEFVVNEYQDKVNPIFFYLWSQEETPPANKPWYLGKISVSDSTNDVGKWDPRVLKNEIIFGTSEPIKGSKIIDVWGSDRSIRDISDDYLAATIGDMTFEDSPYLPPSNDTISFLLDASSFNDAIDSISLDAYEAERLPFVGASFYAGRFFVASGDTIYFSQIIKKRDDAEKCYQQNDPTNELVNELLESDGGTIKIPEAGRIITMRPLSSGILILSNNGMWLISGGDTGFTAKSFKVDKISSIPCRSHYNVLDIENILVVYNEYGIYTLQPSDTGGISVSDITEGTISEFYTEIGLSPIVASKAIYDPIKREFYILYCDIVNSDTTQRYNKVLGAKLPNWAFFKYEVSAEDSPRDSFIYDCYLSPITYAVTGDSQIITSSSDTVINTSSDNVVIEGSLSSPVFGRVTFLAMVGNSNTPTTYWSKEAIFDATRLVDFYSVDNTGVAYSAYLQTGYMVEDDVMRRKQAPYIQCVFNRTESRFVETAGVLGFDRPSSCLMKAYWDWTDHTNSGKVGASQQVYRFTRPYLPTGDGDTFDNGYPVVTTRNKVRGSGRALHLLFTAPENYDCHMVGWGIKMQGLSTV